MNRIFSIVMSCGALIAAGCQQAPDTSAQELSDADWRLVWQDEFDGQSINDANWTHAVDCWGGGNNEKQCYTDAASNSSVDGGVLTITARLEPSRGFALPENLRAEASADEQERTVEQPFSSAKLITKGKADWRYGRFEIRAKLPVGQGTWPAIWMLPADDVYGGWAASGEIDILEAVNLGAVCDTCTDGVENRILGTLHFGGEWPNNAHKGGKTVLPPSEDGFHVFATEWKEGEISWFVDGKHYSTLTSESWHTDSELASGRPAAPFDQNFYLIINLAIGGHLAEDNNEKGVSNAGFPKTMQIDWVRVYQHADESALNQ